MFSVWYGFKTQLFEAYTCTLRNPQDRYPQAGGDHIVAVRDFYLLVRPSTLENCPGHLIILLLLVPLRASVDARDLASGFFLLCSGNKSVKLASAFRLLDEEGDDQLTREGVWRFLR